MCVIKEEDLLLCMDKVNSVPVPKFPVRVVMNNKTISVFTTDDYKTIINSFDLDKLKYFPKTIDDGACMGLVDTRDESKSVSLCVMENYLMKTNF